MPPDAPVTRATPRSILLITSIPLWWIVVPDRAPEVSTGSPSRRNGWTDIQRRLMSCRLFRRILIYCWQRPDPEPDGVERRQENQDQNRADGRAADQRIGHRAPEYGTGQGNEGQHGCKRRQNHGPCALDGGLDDGLIGIEALLLIGMDLPYQDQGVAHQDAGESDQSQDGVEAEGLTKQEEYGNSADEAERRGQHHHAGR